MRKSIFLFLILLISGCASTELAHYSLNDKVFPAQIDPNKKIHFSVDTTYLDSKAIARLYFDYDKAALEKERTNFKHQLIEKIRKSLPENCYYSGSGGFASGSFDKYLVFIPYISISLMEYEGQINVRTAMKIRVYDNAKNKLKDHKIVSDVNKAFTGYNYTGTPTLYITFKFNEDLNNTLNTAINQSVDKAISDSMNVIKDLL